MSPHAKAIEAAHDAFQAIYGDETQPGTYREIRMRGIRAAVVAFMKVELELGDRRTPGWGYLYDTIRELEADRG